MTMLALGKGSAIPRPDRAPCSIAASIKTEFRIEQTMIQAHGKIRRNSPPATTTRWPALLGPDAAPTSRRTRRRQMHCAPSGYELALIAAMQSAVRTLLDGLAPVKLRAQVEQGGGMSLLPAQKKARAWDAYETLHARTVQALADDFDSVFGKAFARAYERSLQEISARNRQ